MKDRIPTYPGRVRLIPVSGQTGVFDMERADEPTQTGTPLNKANLLTDAVAAKYGLGGTAVPNDVLDGLSLLFGDDEPTTATAAATGQIYFDRTHEGWWGCIGKSGGSYLWRKMKPTNSDLFGTRGPIVITASTTFDATQYGLKPGDKLNVVCIGGGGGGGRGGYDAEDEYAYPGNPAGQNGGYGSGGKGGQGQAHYSTGHLNQSGGGGGGSGYFVSKTITLNSNTVAVTIGTHGSSDQNGGATSFGSYLTAPGGAKGSPGAEDNFRGGAGGAGGFPGETGGVSSGSTAGAGGAGGVGVTVTAFPDITAKPSPTLGADGAVLIWY